MESTQPRRKVCVMGYRAVGKSALTIRFCEEHFTTTYNPTIETTLERQIAFRGKSYGITVVDTAGEDEASLLSPHLALDTHGYVLVYSMTSKHSFRVLRAINDRLLTFLGTESCPRVLVCSKIDLESDVQVTPDEGRQLAQEWGCPFIECSSKTNVGVTDVFVGILEEIEKAGKGSSQAAAGESGECLLV